MAFNTFSFVMSDFYFTGILESLIWIKTGYIAMMIALVGFYIAMEQILPFIFSCTILDTRAMYSQETALGGLCEVRTVSL
ncbi:MAG: hypothetical protein P1Q69_19760 [Candidatus Thorarchaeota archaeon]|nr:hypothetical protein [Candidatus Thorarchaeota archaeon]